MRPIDGDVLVEVLTTAIKTMQDVTKLIGAEDDPEMKMEIKAYTDILNGVKEQPTIEPEPQWIPFVLRPVTDEEKEENPDLDYYLEGKLPKDGQKILITVRLPGHEGVRADEFCEDADGSYLDGGYEIGTEAVAWMPMPAPYKEKQK